MRTRIPMRWLGRALAAMAFVVMSASGASAQNTTGTIRGTITGSNGVGLVDAQISARNIETGVVRNTTSRDQGLYVLPGLVPATYDMTVRRIGTSAVTRRVVVQIGATQIQNFSLADRPTQLQSVVVTAAPTVETRTSEVATNVSQAQISKLPSSSRNFLELAGLAPGITVSEDRIGSQNFRTLQAGGQSASAINLFVDGTSFKNDLTGGGVAGQDASRGNPFPQSAIQEYRVISQNFKAEYQKASSAIITATTKSGTNEWTGSALVSYQNASMVSLDSFQRRDKNAAPATFSKPPYNRTLTALSFGGPLIKDKLHMFASYEGNIQNRSNRVDFATPPTGFPALDTVNLRQVQRHVRIALPRRPAVRQADQRDQRPLVGGGQLQQPARDRRARLRPQSRVWGGRVLSAERRRGAGQVQLLHGAVAERGKDRFLADAAESEPEVPRHARAQLPVRERRSLHREQPEHAGLRAEAGRAP